MDILVAEDDTDAAELYRAALEARGHWVKVTFDGRQCLNAYQDAINTQKDLRKKPPDRHPFEVVIIDYKIPKIDGLEVAKEILRLSPHQRIIFASAYTKSTLADAVKELKQVVELIQKPFEPELIVEVVEDKSVIKKIDEINGVASDFSAGSGNQSENEINILLERLRRIQKAGTLS